MILELEQKIDKMNLEHLTAQKIRKCLKKKIVTEYQEPTEGAPRGQNWNNLGSKIK